MTANNPARLIHWHLSHMLNNRAEKNRARDVLGIVFQLPPESDHILRRALILLDGLFVSAEERIRSLPTADHDRFLRHFPQLRKGLAAIHLDNSSPNAFNFVSDAALENLDLCAARIAEAYPERDLPPEDLSELERQIRDVEEFLATAEVEPQLKEVTHALLGVLRRALADFRICGVDGLERALEEGLGKLTLFYVRHGGKVDEKSFGALWALVAKFDAVISRILTYGPYLSEAFERFLKAG